MKKTVFILALAIAMCALASCGKEANISHAPEAMSTSVTTVETSDKAETTAAATSETVSAADAETITANTDNAEDISGLSGYWYANGDPKAAFFHITKDGKFKEYNNYYGAILACTGYINREPDTETGSYAYCMYNDAGEVYKKFAGNSEKSDINFESGDVTHYVKLYDEEGVGKDDRGAAETYAGSWICGRAIIEISFNSEGVFHAGVSWSSSAVAHVIWDYPLELDNGKLVCSGNGKKTFVELKDGETEPTETVEYTNGSAEFTLEGNHLFWNNFNENDADNMLFEKNSTAY